MKLLKKLFDAIPEPPDAVFLFGGMFFGGCAFVGLFLIFCAIAAVIMLG